MENEHRFIVRSIIVLRPARSSRCAYSPFSNSIRSQRRISTSENLGVCWQCHDLQFVFHLSLIFLWHLRQQHALRTQQPNRVTSRMNNEKVPAMTRTFRGRHPLGSSQLVGMSGGKALLKPLMACSDLVMGRYATRELRRSLALLVLGRHLDFFFCLGWKCWRKKKIILFCSVFCVCLCSTGTWRTGIAGVFFDMCKVHRIW